MEEKSPIKSFTELFAWQEGHKLVLSIYKITREFPKDEVYGLTSQIRRCAVSITSNIAEGFGRKTYKDKVQFYIIAQGSVAELENQLLIARDVEYITRDDFMNLANQAIKVNKVVSGLIRESRKRF